MIKTILKDIELSFKTSKELFSPRAIDSGTEFMLSKVDFVKGDKVLDLGCGYGVVGILAAKIIGPENVIMVDVNKEATMITKENSELNNVSGIKIIESDGLTNINDHDFTVILSNPPYHVDFAVPKNFIEKGFNRLKMGGKMYMVTKRKEWYKNKLISVFGGVKIWEEDGYYVFMSIKNKSSYSKR
jgi:16S rRNA (guanine1207-N2)-methyltransferase